MESNEQRQGAYLHSCCCHVALLKLRAFSNLAKVSARIAPQRSNHCAQGCSLWHSHCCSLIGDRCSEHPHSCSAEGSASSSAREGCGVPSCDGRLRGLVNNVNSCTDTERVEIILESSSSINSNNSINSKNSSDSTRKTKEQPALASSIACSTCFLSLRVVFEEHAVSLHARAPHLKQKHHHARGQQQGAPRGSQQLPRQTTALKPQTVGSTSLLQGALNALCNTDCTRTSHSSVLILLHMWCNHTGAGGARRGVLTKDKQEA
eukprot:5071-Heterococcus_DN1.PRE.1